MSRVIDLADAAAVTAFLQQAREAGDLVLIVAPVEGWSRGHSVIHSMADCVLDGRTGEVLKDRRGGQA